MAGVIKTAEERERDKIWHRNRRTEERKRESGPSYEQVVKIFCQNRALDKGEPDTFAALRLGAWRCLYCGETVSVVW